MPGGDQSAAGSFDHHREAPVVDFRTDPSRYRHWHLSTDGPVARLEMDVDEGGGVVEGYDLKLNSYDLGVDIELYDAVQRLRFEHPEVVAVVLASAKDRVFCAGANIRMLAASSHAWKVNFCKFTNETRLGIEDASSHSGQHWIAVMSGPASGGGYELALACEHLILVDDGSSAVSLPEVALLGVLPGTGGLTRVVDKRGVRRDLADVFATRAEGVKGHTAREWGLVDEVAPRSKLDDAVKARVSAFEAHRHGPARGPGIRLTRLERDISDDRVAYAHVTASVDRELRTATLEIAGPSGPQPVTAGDYGDAGADGWALAAVRQLDDVILHLRTNEPEIGTWLLRATGDADAIAAVDRSLADAGRDWLVGEIALYWKRTLKRLDVTSRSLIAVADRGTCFAGTLLELALAADRFYILDEGDRAGVVQLGEANFGRYPMGNGRSRLETRFVGAPDRVDAAREQIGAPLTPDVALKLGLATATPDDIDWDDEIRLAVEERASFSPDALTGMEANLRFPGPETLETKIFGRLSAWQNWIFQRPNAAGPNGALRAYGTGHRPEFDRKRV